MKKRNRKNLFSQEDLENYINELVKGEQAEDFLKDNHDKIIQMLNKNYKACLYDFHSSMFPPIKPNPVRRMFKVKRKNGKIETYIFFSDGSLPFTPFKGVALKKGDQVFDDV